MKPCGCGGRWACGQQKGPKVTERWTCSPGDVTTPGADLAALPPDSRLSYLAASFKIIIITRACVCRHRPERNANNPRVDAWCSHGKHANLLLRLLSARWGKWLLSKVRITSRTGVWPGLTVRAKVPPPKKTTTLTTRPLSSPRSNCTARPGNVLFLRSLRHEP